MKTNTQQANAQTLKITKQGWFNLTTFWQLNLAVGLSMMALFVFAPVPSHALMYQFQHALSSLAAQVGLESKFDLLNILIGLSVLGFFVALRYGKLAQILKINRLIFSMILLANVGLLWVAISDYSPHAFWVLPQKHMNIILSFVAGQLIKTSLWLAVISLIATLLWHYVVKPRHTLKNMLAKLLQAQPCNMQTTQAPKLSKGIAILMLLLLGFIAADVAHKAIKRAMYIFNESSAQTNAIQPADVKILIQENAQTDEAQVK